MATRGCDTVRYTARPPDTPSRSMTRSPTLAARYADLCEQIEQANYQYHVLDDPTLPDA